MKKVLYISIASAVLFSCESQPLESKTEHPSEVIMEDVVVVVEPNQMATLEIKGMECVMACGGSIKKALRKTNGVSDIEFDFETGREFNVASISYNEDVVTMDEMKALILELNDNQFTVGESSTEGIQSKSSSTETNSAKSSSDANVEVSSSAFEMPNLLDLFSSLLPL